MDDKLSKIIALLCKSLENQPEEWTQRLMYRGVSRVDIFARNAAEIRADEKGDGILLANNGVEVPLSELHKKQLWKSINRFLGKEEDIESLLEDCLQLLDED
jgi:hypothetical protein